MLAGEGLHRMRVMQIGLGPIGCAVSRLLVQKPGWQIVAAVDADPAKQGRDLGEIVGLGQRLGVTVMRDLAALQDSQVDLAFLTTVSTFPEVLPTLSTLIQHNVDVVSSTEELFYPYYRYAEQALALDALARQHGVSVLGTGINPGFVMDTLVLVLTGACQHINRIAVTRCGECLRRTAITAKKAWPWSDARDLCGVHSPAACGCVWAGRLSGVFSACPQVAHG